MNGTRLGTTRKIRKSSIISSQNINSVTNIAIKAHHMCMASTTMHSTIDNNNLNQINIVDPNKHQGYYRRQQIKVIRNMAVYACRNYKQTSCRHKRCF